MPTNPRPLDPVSEIAVRGARVHNLQNLDLDVPRDSLVVLTGVSGSGKSSLAFDTLFAEGQRRYIESLSSYARQFLDRLQRPDVDLIEGLPPTIAIDQRSGQASSRSTLGTITEIHDHLRLLFARLGTPHCPRCGRAIDRQTPEQMVQQVLGLTVGKKVMVLAPLVRGRKGQHTEIFDAIRRAGLIRARVDGQMVDLNEQPPKLAKAKAHLIEAVVDRIVIREGIRPRLAESIDLALKLSEGLLLISTESGAGWDDQLMSVHLACPDCGLGLELPEPRSFSFNSPYGACPACQGLGVRTSFEADLVIPDRSRSLDEHAVAPWDILGPSTRQARQTAPDLVSFLTRHALDKSTPLAAWPERSLAHFLLGEPDAKFEGLLAALERDYRSATRSGVKLRLDACREESPCPSCSGSRLRPEARAVTVAGQSIDQINEMTVASLCEFLAVAKFPTGREPVAAPLVREISARLRFLEQVGLGYLTLGRGSNTLSGGELQRARLATQLGAGLVGVCYVLDEPTAGLHPRDTERLLVSLRGLQQAGNSVIVVEHDEAVIRAADWVIDLGPGAGPAGGRVIAQGSPEAVANVTDSLTGRYLHQHPPPPTPTKGSRPVGSSGWIFVRDAIGHNLRNVEAQIPLGALTCVTGVSGSGKSTLVLDVLARGYRRHVGAALPGAQSSGRIEGLEALDSLIVVDQAPIGRSPRSTPATYTGTFDQIRRVFAATRQAKLRGFGASRFSFNAPGGRCETCQGVGIRRIPMRFLPDLHIVCEECQGLRFNRQTLEVRFKGRSVGDVLRLRVDEARRMFDAHPRVLIGLDAMHDVGLGYLTLGQSSTTLSGGEAQRVKLAAQLGRVSTGRTLTILDEPTTGLHFADVERLLTILQRLADIGNTVVIIEHNLDVIASADWVIDLGPEAGTSGGKVIAMGTPAIVAENPESRTGIFLKARLGSPLRTLTEDP